MSIEDKLERIIARVAAAEADFAADVRGMIWAEIQVAGPPASRPGEPPHRRTGKLAAGCFAGPVVRDGDRVTATAGNDTEYAGKLEHGTDRVDARPFIRPVRERIGPLHRDKVRAAVRGR